MAAPPLVKEQLIVVLTAAIIGCMSAATPGDPSPILLRPVNYIKYANGTVDNASLTLNVQSVLDCGAICRQKLVCPAFSVRENPAVVINASSSTSPRNRVECSVVLGADYTWTPDPSSRLFAENIGDVRGYAFHRDGRFYKVFWDRQLNVTDSRVACIDQGGTFAVPHPRFRYDVLTAIPELSNATLAYFVGITGAGNGRWVTDDGSIFIISSSSSDPNQVWAAAQPDGTSNATLLKSFDGTLPLLLDDGTPGKLRPCYVCRRGSAYRQLSTASVAAGSNSGGKFYRLYGEKADYHSAAARCASDGGSLASFVQDPHFGAMERFTVPLTDLPPYQFGNEFGLWIAGTDEATEGLWRFPDGTVLNTSERSSDPLQTRFFKPNEPNSKQDENCLALGPEGAFDIPCNRRLRFICEISPSV